MKFVVFNRTLELPSLATDLAKQHDFELAGYVFDAQPETARAPRVIRIGSIQNKIILPTSAPVTEQVSL